MTMASCTEEEAKAFGERWAYSETDDDADVMNGPWRKTDDEARSKLCLVFRNVHDRHVELMQRSAAAAWQGYVAEYQSAANAEARAERLRVDMFNENVKRLATMIDDLAAARDVRLQIVCGSVSALSSNPDAYADSTVVLSRMPCVGESVILPRRRGGTGPYVVVRVTHFPAKCVMGGVTYAGAIAVDPITKP